jgi:pilus assembly protein FimV
VFDFQGADDLELDVAGEAAPFEQAADQPASELSDDLDLDLDLDLDGESLDQPLASAPGQDGAVELGDDLSFSLDESALDDSDLKGGLDRLAKAESVDTEDTLSFDLDDELDLELDEDFELEFDEDMESKLNLARAYVDMGDAESARRTLEEVIAAGSDAEIREARALLEQVG